MIRVHNSRDRQQLLAARNWLLLLDDVLTLGIPRDPACDGAVALLVELYSIHPNLPSKCTRKVVGLKSFQSST